MENASKALIIAGAILLAILLISLGIYIFTGAQDVTKNSGLDAQEVSVFNSAMLKYEGTNKSLSDIRAIKNEAVVANKKLKQEGKNIGSNNSSNLIEIKFNDARPVLASEFDTTQENFSESEKKYTITLKYNEATGLVRTIEIKD